jgi:putative ABC transport system permease protein
MPRSIGGLSSLAWRAVRARPVRATLTTIGIALGVAVLYAGLLTNLGIDRSIDRSVSDLLGRADVRVAALDGGGLSAEAVTAIESIPGVAVAAPQIERRTYLAASVATGGGSSADALPPAVTVLGVDPALDPRVHDSAIVAGTALAGSAEPSALISEQLAHETRLGVGDEIGIDGSVAAEPSDLRFRIVGLLAGDGPLPDALGRVIVVPLDRAARAFAPISVSRLDLVLEPGVTADAVSAELAKRLTSEPYVLSSPDQIATALRSSTAEFQATTALVAAVALFAGAFLIFNTLAMTVVERVREVGLLRAAGATRRQVLGVVLVAAAILGSLGSLGGLAFGSILASLMSARAGDAAGFRIGEIPSSASAALVAVLAGMAVTLAAAAEPAIRASRIPPVEALKPRLGPGLGTGARLRWLVAVFVAVAAAGALLWPAAGGPSIILPGAVAYAVLLGLALAVPWLVGPVGRVAGVPFAAVLRAEERLARGALARDRARATLTVGALAVGLAMLVALGGVAADARGSATSWIASVVPGDVLATSVTPRPLDEGLGIQLAASPGVARVSPISTFAAAFRGIRVDVAAVVGADLLADGRLSLTAGDRTAALHALDAGGSAIVPQALATRLGLRVGDSVEFPVGGGHAVELRVAGIVARSIPGTAGEAILVGWNDATTGFGLIGASSFAIRFSPGASAGDRLAASELAASLGLQPTSLSTVEGAVGDALGRVFGLFDALALLAVVIGGLGIANTLSMNVLERVRELGVLRAAGMTRRQVWRMVVVEAGILGLVGALLGIVGGLVAGVGMRVVGPAGSLAGSVPWPSIGLALVLGLGVSMLAAAYPAWLAGRQSIVRAVRAE